MAVMYPPSAGWHVLGFGFEGVGSSWVEIHQDWSIGEESFWKLECDNQSVGKWLPSFQMSYQCYLGEKDSMNQWDSFWKT